MWIKVKRGGESILYTHNDIEEISRYDPVRFGLTVKVFDEKAEVFLSNDELDELYGESGKTLRKALLEAGYIPKAQLEENATALMDFIGE